MRKSAFYGRADGRDYPRGRSRAGLWPKNRPRKGAARECHMWRVCEPDYTLADRKLLVWIRWKSAPEPI